MSASLTYNGNNIIDINENSGVTSLSVALSPPASTARFASAADSYTDSTGNLYYPPTFVAIFILKFQK